MRLDALKVTILCPKSGNDHIKMSKNDKEYKIAEALSRVFPCVDVLRFTQGCKESRRHRQQDSLARFIG